VVFSCNFWSFDMDEARRRRPLSSIDLDADIAENKAIRSTKRIRKRRKNVSFWQIFCQVSFVTFFLSCIVTWSYRQIFPKLGNSDVNEDGDDTDHNFEEGLDHEKFEQTNPSLELKIDKTPPSLPTWNLTEKAEYDAYGLLEKYSPSSSNFWNLAKNLRDEFSLQYGGENSARAILERALTTFGLSSIASSLPSDLQATACRIPNSGGVFKIAFGGYSVTAGRGNYFSQSYPFVMQTKLEPILDALNIDLEVRNAAIGGASSFPYGWCLENFWGTDPDVVSWDFSLNEPGGIPQGLEAYLRQTQTLLGKKPKVIIKDTHMAFERREMLKSYFQLNSSLVDPVVLHGEPAIEPFMAIEEDFRPQGFREWRKFGAPPGVPGQAVHHPSKNEHQLYGWILTMHFLAALQLYVLHQEEKLTLSCIDANRRTMPSLPITTNETKSLLFDVTHKINCWTTFEPVLKGLLLDIVSDGLIDSGKDLLMPKGAIYYNKGWVLDLSDAEKLAKRQLVRVGGLGFVDSKKAFYGIYASGPLSFHLPINKLAGATFANDVIHSIVICQVKEHLRHHGACQLNDHLNVWIGGQLVLEKHVISDPGTTYLGQKLCVDLIAPVDSVITSYEGENGINLTVQVHDNSIMKKELACSISHVIFEEQNV
jgi:hypothetical protein